jgi:LacI family gluconate utilization system Gnt-I transcriptional repressor
MSRHTAQAGAARPASRAPAAGAGAPVRLVEVARLAGVSAMTVSRALRHPEQVAPATLRAVQQAVVRLGYLPHGSASALASSRSRVVAAIVPTLMHSVYASTVQGLSAALRPAGYELMIGDSGYDPAVEASLVRSFLGRRVDALVLTGVEHADDTRALLARHPVPVVEIWDLTDTPIDRVVGFSNVAAGVAAGRHLAGRGRRRWAFLGTPGRSEGRSGKRLRGFRQAAREAGVPAPAIAPVADGMSAAEAREATAALLAERPDVDALFCANDALAIGALRAARDLGWPVPQRLAVVGFGDFDVAAQTQPALTTLRIPGPAIGRRAAQVLLARLGAAGAGAADARRHDLAFELVEREST